MKYTLTGIYLRTRREQKGYTQQELQRFIGYAGTNGFVSSVELGKRMYSNKILKRLVKKLDLDVDCLIEYYGTDTCQNARQKLRQSISR